ncbi:hypothetical protein [Phenylobacterium sp.]|uniref:hypothetical protein n=1 Tax=Phenylobacterium sp. TaxID=1871053 RepID=UPI0025D7818D|nr:hypothetical protein [Phenylobacterium sp.]
MAAAQAGKPTVTPPASAGLQARPEPLPFSLDLINEGQEPRVHRVSIRGGRPVTFAGWAYDPVARGGGKGVDIVLDGVAYGAGYGRPRPDVADHFKIPAVAASGFAVTLPAYAVGKGKHTVVVRLVAADGLAYFDGPAIEFRVH